MTQDTSPVIRSPLQALRQPVTVLFILILLLSAGMRLWDLGGKSYWVDEIFEAEVVAGGFARCVQYARGDVTPPLHYLLNVIPYHLSPNEFGLRIMSVLAGIGGVAAFFFLLRRWMSPAAALAGMFFLAINREHLHHSQDSRMYAWMVLFSILATWALDRMVEGCCRPSGDRKSLVNKGIFNRQMLIHTVLFILFTLLNVYNSYFAFFLLAAHLLWACGVILLVNIDRKRFDNLIWPALALVAILLFYLPWFPTLLKLVSGEVTTSTESAFSRWWTITQGAATTWGSGGWPFLLLAFAVGIIFMILRDKRHATLILSAILVPMIYILAAQSKHFFDTRYILFLLPLGLAVAAYAIDVLWQVTKPLNIHVWVLCALPFIYTATCINGLREYYLTEKMAWRSAADYMTQNLQNNDLIITGINAGDASLVHYLARKGFNIEMDPHTGIYRLTRPGLVTWVVGRVRQKEAVEAFTKKYPKVWYVGAYLQDPRAQPVYQWFQEKATPGIRFSALTEWGVIEIYRYPKI